MPQVPGGGKGGSSGVQSVGAGGVGDLHKQPPAPISYLKTLGLIVGGQ